MMTSLKAVGFGALSPPESVDRFQRREAPWSGALRLAKSGLRRWQHREKLSAASSAETMSQALQRASLSRPSAADELGIAVHYQPADHQAQIGGDWFDAFVDATGATLLTIGDVSGHDHQAAATMGQLRTLLRGLAFDADDAPSRLLSRLDAAMAGLRFETLATAVVARVEPSSDNPKGSTRRVCWSSAGHLPPLLRAPDGAVTRLEVEPDLLLGVCPETPRFDHAVELEAGSTLLLYTDGLVERRDEDLDDGIEGLATMLSNLGRLDPDPLCDAIIECTGAGEDDVALLVLRCAG